MFLFCASVVWAPLPTVTPPSPGVTVQEDLHSCRSTSFEASWANARCSHGQLKQHVSRAVISGLVLQQHLRYRTALMPDLHISSVAFIRVINSQLKGPTAHSSASLSLPEHMLLILMYAFCHTDTKWMCEPASNSVAAFSSSCLQRFLTRCH